MAIVELNAEMQDLRTVMRRASGMTSWDVIKVSLLPVLHAQAPLALAGVGCGRLHTERFRTQERPYSVPTVCQGVRESS